MNKKPSVLIVASDVTLALDLMRIVTGLGLPLCGHAKGAEQAVSMAAAHAPSLVILDADLAGPNTAAEAALMIAETGTAPIICLVGGDQAEGPVLEPAGAAALLSKPVNVDALGEAIQRALGPA